MRRIKWSSIFLATVLCLVLCSWSEQKSVSHYADDCGNVESYYSTNEFEVINSSSSKIRVTVREESIYGKQIGEFVVKSMQSVGLELEPGKYYFSIAVNEGIIIPDYVKQYEDTFRITRRKGYSFLWE